MDLAVFVVGLFRQGGATSLVVLAANTAAGLLPGLQVWALNRFVALAAADPRAALGWIAVLLAALPLGSWLRSLRPYYAGLLRDRLGRAMALRVLDRVMRAPLLEFEEPRYHDRVNGAQSALGMENLADFLEECQRAFVTLLSLAGVLVVLGGLDVWAAVVAGGAALPLVWLNTQWARASSAVYWDMTPLRRRLEHWAGLLLSPGNGTEIRLFGLAPLLVERWRGIAGRVRAQVWALGRRQAAQRLGVDLGHIGLNAALVAWLSYQTWAGRLAGAGLVAGIYALQQLHGLVSDLVGHVYSIGVDAGMYRHLKSLLDAPAADRSGGAVPSTIVVDTAPPAVLRHGIVLDDVSFTYPRAAQPALDGVSLHLRPGERVALVGENGAGKTTLVKLLLGLYPPSAGAILVDGVDLATVDADEWWKRTAVLPQDFVRYQPLTLRDNIGVGDVDHLYDERVERAARRSGADAVALALPRGYEALMGVQFGGGAELSRGQWQRVALARVLMRERPALVVLDEPTAALDPLAEVEIHGQFYRAVDAAVTVVVSHRLGSARLADRVVVLHGGRVVEVGPHEDLLARGGRYAEMWHAQASWYRGAPASGGPEEPAAP